METMAADGTARPSGGTLSAFDPPSGPGIRVDTFGYAGYTTSPRFDSLLAKVIVHSPSPRFADVLTRAGRALREFGIDGVATNLAFLEALLAHPDVSAGRVSTTLPRGAPGRAGGGGRRCGAATLFGTGHQRRAGLAGGVRLGPGPGRAPGWTPATPSPSWPTARATPRPLPAAAPPAGPRGGPSPPVQAGPEGTVMVAAPMQGTIVSIDVGAGRPGPRRPAGGRHGGHEDGARHHGRTERHRPAHRRGAGRHRVRGPPAGLRRRGRRRGRRRRRRGGGRPRPHPARPGRGARTPRASASTRPAPTPSPGAARPASAPPGRTSRTCATRAPSSSTGRWSSPPSAARRTVEDLIEKTPADGLLAGIGRVNGDLFPDDRAQTVRHVLRLHRPGRHPGHAQPPQEGPHVRAGRALAAAGRVLRRGRRRAARRHRRRGGAGLDCLAFDLFGKLSRARAAGGHQLGPLLRRQRRPARLLRRGHRHRATRTSAWAARP